MDIEITNLLRHQIKYDEHAKVFVSYCPALDIWSQGENEDEAKTALDSAVRLFVNACCERGTLEGVLGNRKCLHVASDDDASDDYISVKIGINPPVVWRSLLNLDPISMAAPSGTVIKMSNLARYVTFTLHPHDNADALSIAHIDGTDWQCVTQTSQWSGDAHPHGPLAGIYIGIDALVDPARPEFAFLASKASKKFADGRPGHRIKTIRLRGKLSQGLLIPLLAEYPADAPTDWAAFLGIERYEPPTPTQMGGDQVRCPGSFRAYTGIENAKNHPNAFAEGEMVRILEKCHGTNARVGFVDEGRDVMVYMVGTHATARDPAGGNLYSTIARRDMPPEKLLEVLTSLGLNPVGKQHVIVFFEIFGFKVQDLQYGCAKNEQKVCLFDVCVDDVFQPFETVQAVAAGLGLKTAPVLYRGPYSRSAVMALRDGKTTIGGDHVREGVVVTAEPEVRFIGDDGGSYRKILKFISDDYLLRSGEKDGH